MSESRHRTITPNPGALNPESFMETLRSAGALKDGILSQNSFMSPDNFMYQEIFLSQNSFLSQDIFLIQEYFFSQIAL